MDYKKFEDNVRMDLPKSLLGTFPHISVEPAEVTKLQGMSYSGISVRQDGSQMSMTVNLDSFYRDYESGAVYEDVLQGITDYVVTHISQTPEFDLDMLKNYESMRPYLTVQMVEKNRNAEKLAEIPHEIVEDMAVVYRFQLGDLPDGKASVLITNPMLEHYGITQEQLHQDALEMAQRSEPLSIKNMDEIMYEMTNGFMGSLDEACSPMYVATNASRMNGAAVMNYPDFMEQAAEKLQGSFYILPSSIHELIMIPDSFEMRSAELKAMVTEINASEVRPEERLTDNVYHYDAIAKVLEQAEHFEQRMENKQERKSVLGALGEKKQACQMQESKPRSQNKREEPAL